MSSSSLNGKMKNQEDPNIRVLRELTHIPANRHCFDCGQRGPTYVNVTIGSFICMTCSGLLFCYPLSSCKSRKYLLIIFDLTHRVSNPNMRGLTPPHRVKSISMASFTSDEIEVLKSRGNEYCRKVWLATCSAKDAHLGSEKDPERMNLLKNFMSAKYEQKRFYVDPSKLPKGELSEIQSQTAKALSSTSMMQKSPSLSSTRSSGSQQSSPSPVLNNLRNHPTGQPSRLVNSVTLPDIKPLTSLIGPSVPTLTSNSNKIQSSDPLKVLGTPSAGPNPVNFINNLSAGSIQNPAAKVNNNNTNILNVSPWASDSNGDHKDNNFGGSDTNFADFEDAFSSNKINGVSFGNSDLFAGQNFVQNSNVINGDGVATAGVRSNSASLPPPMLPFHNTGGSFYATSPVQFPPQNSTGTGGSEDKYAALKDLDSLFKQGANGDSANEGSGVAVPLGMTSSTSLPANLSTSAATGQGWFSTSPNQNPFSQAPTPGPPQGVNAWGISNGMNGSSNGGNPHNPFFGTGNAWKSSNQPVANSGGFPAAPSQLFTGMTSSGIGQQCQPQRFPSTVAPNPGKPFNPFFTPASNPNNPFL